MNLVPELIIGPSDGHPRTLRICWDATHATVAVYGPTGFGQRYSFARARHAECRLDLTFDRLLWLDSACFDLTEAEALQVRTVLEPHGLRIQTHYSPQPAAPSLAAAHEAAVADDSPLHGDGGTTPLGIGPPRGSLDDSYDHFTARFLTAGEVL